MNETLFNFGWEVELMLIDAAQKAMHEETLDFDELKKLLNAIDTESLYYFVEKYPGSNYKPYYLEGYDIIDSSGNFHTLRVKGIEISTPIAHSIDELGETFSKLFSKLTDALETKGLKPVFYGSHPEIGNYSGPQGTRSQEGWASAENAMSTFGLHINISLPETMEKKLNKDLLYNIFNYYAPALLLVSANTPYKKGKEWLIDGRIGISERSYRRSFTRKPIYFRYDQNYRKEVTIFDVNNNLNINKGLTELCLGLMLSKKDVPVITDNFCIYNQREVALKGFKADCIDRNFNKIDIYDLTQKMIGEAAENLAANGFSANYIPLISEMAKKRECPAHLLVNSFDGFAQCLENLSCLVE